MKFGFQWKDPDFYDYLHRNKEWQALNDDDREVEWEKLDALGIDEYLQVDVDTDTGVVEVRRKARS